MEKREIKFRAWDGFNESMLRPEDVNGNTKDLSWFFSQYDEANRGGNDLKLMQFTGLKDKNGKEIYEGDIVIIGDKKYPRVIEWHKIGLRVKQINSPNNFPLHYPFVGKDGLDTDWEIIGNIYQHPELLKATE